MPILATQGTLKVNQTKFVATQGVLDAPLGIATLGWLIRETSDLPPSIERPPLPGALYTDPNRDWWIRRDESDVWHGPLSYRDANFQARRMTVDADNSILEVKYAQIGTNVGDRGGDPKVAPHMIVVYIYANGRQYLGGRMAEFNKDKVPPE